MLTANINFRPLYGCSPDEPYCSLLSIDKFTILLDCGWTDDFDEALLQPLKQVISEIDAVLISYPDLEHVGALPYAVGKLGLNAPIYCTLPVYRMAVMFLYEAYENRKAYNFKVFDLDDVDAIFNDDSELMENLKYSQDKKLGGKGEGITITPRAAGHMVGGTFWQIRKETEDIVYAVDFNHTQERHLRSGILESFAKDNKSRPSVLITDASSLSPDYVKKHMQRKEKDKILTESIMKTLRNGGNVLMPVDAAGRIIEVALLLHQFWEQKKFSGTYTLIILSEMGYFTRKECSQKIEWMSEDLHRMVAKGITPFEWNNLVLCRDLKALAMHKDKPFVCLATSSTMRTGFSQELFRMLGEDPKNLLIFTQRAPKGTLANDLMQEPTPNSVSFVRHQLQDLSGLELKQFMEEKQIQKEQKELEEANAQLMSDTDDDSDDNDDNGDVTFTRFQPTHVFPMFPFHEEKREFDDYGEIINPDDYKTEREVKIQRMEEDDIIDLRDDDEIPQKTVEIFETMEVKCGVQFIDYEGRSDGESVIKILQRLSPRKLILIHGEDSAKKRLANENRIKNNTKEIRIPENGQGVDITSETNVIKVDLSDSLLHSLKFVEVEGYEIAYAEGQVSIDYQKNPNPLLMPAPEASYKGHERAYLGTRIFSDIKKMLNSKGIKAEFFQDGVLVCCGGTVNLRKEAENTRISIQGALTEDYFKVREILYSTYDVL